jgi:hypothetical protein
MILNGKPITIYAVDFDGTLIVGNHWPGLDGQMNYALIRYLLDEQLRGNKIILNTNRQDGPLEEAIKICKEYGLEFDAINSNLPEVVEAYGSDSRKISADYYIDDRAINPNLFNWQYMNRLGLKIGYKQHEGDEDVKK